MNTRTKSATGFLGIFPIVAAVVSLIAQLCFLYYDWHYTTLEKSSLLSSIPPQIQNDQMCLLNLHDCIGKALNLSNNAFESPEWTELLGTATYSVSQAWVNADVPRPIYKISMKVKTNVSETKLVGYFAHGGGFQYLFPTLFDPKTPATVVTPPVLALDWSQGSANVQYALSPLLWPLYDRSFTVLHIVHPATRTMVATALPLSAVQSASLLGAHHTYRGTQSADLHLALRVTPETSETRFQTSVTSVYRIDVVYAAQGVLQRKSLDYPIVKNWYLPNLARAVRERVRVLNKRLAG